MPAMTLIRMKNKKPKFETFNDGNAKIYCQKDVSEPGKRPDIRPVLLCSCNFEYRTIGVKRNYEAAQAQVRLDEMISVPMNRVISTQCIAVIDCIQYEIKQVQHKADTLPPTSLLSLTRLESRYADL